MDWLGSTDTNWNRLGTSRRDWGGIFYRGGKPRAKGAGRSILHSAQSEVGRRLVVCVDAQSDGARRSGFLPLIGDLVSVTPVCALGDHPVYASVALLREDVRRTGIRDSVWGVVLGLQVKNPDVDPEKAEALRDVLQKCSRHGTLPAPYKRQQGLFTPILSIGAPFSGRSIARRREEILRGKCVA
jgi:hypothetical protein